MVKKVNISNIELEILGLFTKSYDKQYYIRETSKILNISSRTSLLNLNKLEKKGILESYTKGKIRLFKIKESFLAKNYFLLVEQYKLVKFLEKNNKIKEVVKKLTLLIKGTAIIFGSYAKFRAKKDSDIDIYIETKNRNIKKQIENIHSKISVKIGLFDVKSNLIKEIIKNHVIVRGVEDFYEKKQVFK